MSEPTPESPRPAMDLDAIVEAGGLVSFRRFIVLANCSLADGAEKLERLGSDFGTYAGALRELERHTDKHPGAWVTEILYQFALDVEAQRKAFVRMFEDTERELRELHG